MSMKDVAIFGAGITGLTCAYRLARAAHQVAIYDKSDELGGLVGSFERGEFSICPAFGPLSGYVDRP